MDPALRLLIVEDQADLAANLWDYFSRRGHVVDHAADGQSGLRMALSGEHDLIVLDLGLPRLDGLDLCRRLREAGRGVPVIMLTARDTLEDKLKGFSGGADDYLVKPFAIRELEARIRALARRGRPPAGSPIEACGVRFDPSALIVRREGRQIVLTRAQARILECLMRHSPGVVDQARLMRAVWGPEGGDPSALHTHMYGLRQVLDKPFAEPLLHTVHGIGYRFGTVQ
ncbi:response regulator transcription factor [Arenimonas fontis]|jgi:DNA-binding response OmpR family regulator|uniref:Response regulator transcription factor n=1 Tax=Arenimonas fontis TaxID=2608255 RepID=A0A5B2Z8S3_9GAMM|nr:response regulator transcription factor [Arenimonas fontis]KAA2285108.1 response regulator transcription factor [Arenimonas fontis]